MSGARKSKSQSLTPFLLALALPAAALTVPELPPRDNLPGTLTGAEGAAVPAEASWDEVKEVVLNGRPSQARVDAVFVLHRRASRAQIDDKKGFPGKVMDSIDVMERLYEKEADRPFRRYAIGETFGDVAAAVRDHIPFHPKEAWARKAWARLDRLRRRCLKDSDPKLAEFFLRYDPLPGGPRWEPLKAEAKAYFEKAEAELPEKKEMLGKVWTLCLSIEDSQRAVSERLEKVVRKNAVKDTEAYVKAYRATFEHRAYSLWGNLCPRNFVEQLGADEASRRGCKVHDVKLGWPEFPKP